MSVRGPEVLCRPDDLHVAETARLLIVTSRPTDLARWFRLVADDPEASGDWPEKDLKRARKIRLSAIADPIGYEQPRMPVDPNFLFFAGLDQQTRHLVSGVTITSKNGVSELGGAVHRDYRGQGYGHEMLTAVCSLVHGHFGVERLVAACESTNTASRHWLAGAGFVNEPGAPTYKLPNGRVIEPMWWNHVDPEAELRCSRPRPLPRRRLFWWR